MHSLRHTVGIVALVLGLGATAVQARDAAQPHAARPAQPPPPAARVIPNPYAPAPIASDRAGNAYATGFAIGLGAALIDKQHEDERKRQQEQAGARR